MFDDRKWQALCGMWITFSFFVFSLVFFLILVLSVSLCFCSIFLMIFFWFFFLFRFFLHILCKSGFSSSDHQIVNFPANRNRNRLAEPTSVQIGKGIVCEFQNLPTGIGIIFVRWEVFANNSQIPDINFFSKKCQKILFLDSYIFFI